MSIEISVRKIKVKKDDTAEMTFDKLFASGFGVESKNIIKILLRRRNIDEAANGEADDEFIAFCATVKNFFKGKGDVAEFTMTSNKMGGDVVFYPKYKNGKMTDGFLISIRASEDTATEYYKNNFKTWFYKKQEEPLKEEMRHYDIIINDKIYKSYEAALNYITVQIIKL